MVAKVKKYPDQNIVSFASSADDDWQNYGSDLPRAEGTKSQDLLTAVSVCTDKKEIRLVRIGSNFTMDMRDRTYITIPYGQENV
jgi:hypothetical protein